MAKIAICDDNPMQQDIIKDQVGDYLKDHNLDASINLFSSGDDLIADVQSNGGYDLYLLDMIMPGTKGIGVGESLRNMNDSGKIIFMTVTSAFESQSSKVQAAGYLLKPVQREKLFELLGTCL